MGKPVLSRRLDDRVRRLSRAGGLFLGSFELRTMSAKTVHFFSAERSIERLDDDRLQRRGFAVSVIEKGRLLLLSPFAASQKRATAELAQERNKFVATVADRVCFIYGGTLQSLANQLRSGGRPLLRCHGGVMLDGNNRLQAFWRPDNISVLNWYPNDGDLE
jgi:hypothetical protein